MRRTLSAPFDTSLGDDDMDDIERAVAAHFFVIEPDDGQKVFFGEVDEQRVLLTTRNAPARPDVE